MLSSAVWLREAYPTDLEASLSDELLQFSAFLKTDFAERSSDAATSPAAPAVSPVPPAAPAVPPVPPALLAVPPVPPAAPAVPPVPNVAKTRVGTSSYGI